jgi:hypothetical protein
VLNKCFTFISVLIVLFILTACSEARRDPCQLLSVEDVKSVDDSVAISIWAGRDGERKEDEVCVFHTKDGDPRVMLFVWYDKGKEPNELVTTGETEPNLTVVEVPGVGSNAAATFNDDKLKTFAVKSPRGVVGLRVRKTIRRDSADFSDVAQLAEKALSRY